MVDRNTTPIIYLTIDQVVDFHAEVIALGGSDGLRSHQLLASAIFSPQQSAFGDDAYQTIAEKAAAYGYFLCMNHPFLDGNKRTALAAMAAFLDVNGYELIEDDDAIAQMFEDASAGIVEQGEFFGWVVNHTRPIPLSNVVSMKPQE